MSTLDNRPLSAFERWMVRQSVENCRTAGRDRVLANLTAGGYHRVAEAVAEQTAGDAGRAIRRPSAGRPAGDAAEADAGAAGAPRRGAGGRTMSIPRLSRLALLTTEAEVAALQERAAAPEIVSVGWDGANRPMWRYRDDLPLPDHMRRIVAKEHRPR